MHSYALLHSLLQCEPDMLGDHDSGGLLADSYFITSVATQGPHSHFDISFNGSVVTRYCVERAVPPTSDWADYLSCNGPYVTDYTCLCTNWIDRCIARQDISVCDLDIPFGPNLARMPHCNCTAASLHRSALEVGRMPVFAPFPRLLRDWNCTKYMPPPSDSIYLGAWYSTPASASCPPGVSPAAIHGSVTGCSWSRREAQYFVNGADLYKLGFNTSFVVDEAELLQNRDVLKLAFEKHTARCCGC